MNRNLCIITLAGLLSGFGCAAGTHTADVKDRDNPFLEKDRVQWNSSKLKYSLRIEKLVPDRTESGLMRIRMILRNKTKQDIVVDIRTLFLGDDGFEKEKTNWEPVLCTARSQTQHEVVSMNANVDDYQIIIRDPRDFSWKP